MTGKDQTSMVIMLLITIFRVFLHTYIIG